MSELSREARDLIESTLHADNPSEEDRARVRARLAAQLGAVAVSASLAASSTVVSASSGGVRAGALSAPAGAQGAGGLSLFKIVMVTGLASVIGASAAWLARRPEEPASAKIAAAASSASAHEEAALAQPLPGSTQATVEPEVANPPAQPAAQAGREGPVGKRVPMAPRRPLAAEPQSASSLAEELALLARAQKALRDGEPGHALAHAHEHRRRFPRGSLREERYGIEALARCARGEDGAEVVAALTRLSPNSPLLGRVRAACEREP